MCHAGGAGSRGVDLNRRLVECDAGDLPLTIRRMVICIAECKDMRDNECGPMLVFDGDCRNERQNFENVDVKRGETR